MSTKRFSKPLPYMVQKDSYPIAQDAKWLREAFGPSMKRRLPTVYYAGWRSDFIVQYVQKHKQTHPFFLKLDIAKFFPSISYQQLMVEAQMAYKRLHSLEYVPKSFKREFLPKSTAFFNSLPIAGQGIPLNSSFSKAIAPLLYVRFFLNLKAHTDVRFIVFVDDVLFLCKDIHQQKQVFQDFNNFLVSVSLQLNVAKVQQGRFSTDVVDFCGWRFAGGYAGVSKQKTTEFLDRLQVKGKHSSEIETRQYIKRINQSIQGFGNYYKHGHVLRTFTDLDAKIRSQVRKDFQKRGWAYPSNDDLKTLGLRSLSDIKMAIKTTLLSKEKYVKRIESVVRSENHSQLNKYPAYFEHLINQNAQIIGLLTKLVTTVDKCLVF